MNTAVVPFPLVAATPRAWVDAAALRLPELLLDHASCEKKAASTAIALMFSYAEDRPLATRLSRLAREELRHFEQVDALIRELGIEHIRLGPGRYAANLRRAARAAEPSRKLDLLLLSALIEARSCERFRLLAPALAGPVAHLYASLEVSEARHFEIYLGFAEKHARRHGDLAWRSRLEDLAELEGRLATEPDPQFRFHSGPPTASTAP